MIVTMIPMGMMKMAVDEVIDVVAVRHGIVPTAGPMNVAKLVTRPPMFWCATIRVAVADLDHVLVDMVAVRMMKMSAMQVVDMVTMTDGHAAAARAMSMVVVRMMGEIAVCNLSVLQSVSVVRKRARPRLYETEHMGIGNRINRLCEAGAAPP